MYIQFIYIVYTTYTQRIYIINCFYVCIVFEIMNIKVFLYNLRSSMWILKYNCLELAYLNIFIVEWSLDICSVYWSVERETSPVPVVGVHYTLQDEYCRKMGAVIHYTLQGEYCRKIYDEIREYRDIVRYFQEKLNRCNNYNEQWICICT